MTKKEVETEIQSEQVSEADSVVERLVNKVQKVITLKKVLSEKQKAHLDKIALKRKGKKFVEQVNAENEPDVEVVTKQLKKKKVEVDEASKPHVEVKPKKKIVKKKAVKKIKKETESESEPEQKPKRTRQTNVLPPKSLFTKSLF